MRTFLSDFRHFLALIGLSADTVAMADIAKQLAGKFIVLDGPDGSGKGTQLALLARWLESQGLDVTRAVDPGGTPAGEHIRDILLHRKDLSLDCMCETLLFMASRAQLVAEIVCPAIRQGRVVLCDRFISATLAYQGALGVAPEKIVRLGEIAVNNHWPDFTVVLDMPAKIGLSRVGKQRDRLESRTLDYHEKVRELFCSLDSVYPASVGIVDANAAPEEVTGRITRLLETHFAR